MTRLIVPIALLFVVAGCGPTRPADEVERGKRAVAAALDGWKAGEPTTKLKELAEPIDFTEELSATHALTGYEIGKIDTSDKEVIRYTVTLRLRDRKGAASDREVVYAVALKSPVVVARDPYY